MLTLLLILLAWSIVAKIVVGIVGGQWYGLSKKVSIRAGFSLTQRGEFSVIIASLATGATKLFSSIFILSSAVLGIALFLFAPKIANWLYPKKVKAKTVSVEG